MATATTDISEELRSRVEKRARQLGKILAVKEFTGVLQEVSQENITQLEETLEEVTEKAGMDFDALKQEGYEDAARQLQGEEDETGVQSPEEEEERPDEDEGLCISTWSETSSLSLRACETLRLEEEERRRLNREAIAIAENKQIREITTGDVDTLRKYTGLGGLTAESLREEAQGQDQFFTPYDLSRAVWDLLEEAGLEEATVLEPGSGVGTFIGMRPTEGDYDFLAVEKDSGPARVSELLYPEATVLSKSLTEVRFERYDLTAAIGNVPFGQIALGGADEAVPKAPIHDYFILRALQSLREGGVCALITSTSTADKRDARYRQEMLRRARLVGAWRLPSGMFGRSAGTDVTTDLLVFQRHDQAGLLDEDEISDLNDLSGLFASEPDVWENEDGDEAPFSRVFSEREDLVLGEAIQGYQRAFDSSIGVRGSVQGAIDALQNATLELPHSIPEKPDSLFERDGSVQVDTARAMPVGAVRVEDGTLYQKGRYRWTKVDRDLSGEDLEHVGAALRLLESFEEMVGAKAKGNVPDVDATELQEQAAAYVDQYNYPGEDDLIQEVLRSDPRLPKLELLISEGEGGQYEWADIFYERKVYSDRYEVGLGDDEDLNEITTLLKAQGEELALDNYAGYYKGGTATPEETEQAMAEHPHFYYSPSDERFEHRYEYLSGNLAQKLRKARAQGLSENVEAIEEARPEQTSIYDINLDPRHMGSYLGEGHVQAWLRDVLSDRSLEVIAVMPSEAGFEEGEQKGRVFRVKASNNDRDKEKGWGDQYYSTIVQWYLNGSNFERTVVGEEGEPTGVALKEASDEQVARANEFQQVWHARMLREIPADFAQWVQVEADQEVREEIEEAFNETLNSYVSPGFDGTTFKVRGMSDTFDGIRDFDVWPHNVRVAEKLAWMGKGVDAHDVGSGKTLAGILSSQMMQQRGLCEKPLFVVPGQVRAKWRREYVDLFPDAKTLTIDLNAEDSDRTLALAQLGDWDAIFISQAHFKRWKMSPSTEEEYLERRVERFEENMEAYLDQVEDDDSEEAERLEKRLASQLENLEETLKEVRQRTKGDEDIGVYFDEAGVDFIFLDEAHAYKNAIGSPRAIDLGIALREPSQRAEDALRKADWLREEMQTGGRGVIGLTATPIPNSPVEIWHMLRLCAPEFLEEIGVAYMDDFVDLFIRTGQVERKSVTGEYVTDTKVQGYRNLKEMRELIEHRAEIRSYDQLQRFYEELPGETQPFSRPPHDQIHVEVPASRVHQMLFEDLEHRAEIIGQTRNPDFSDNYLSITQDGSNIAADLRLFDEQFEGLDPHPSQKIEQLAARAAKYYAGEVGPQSRRENPSHAKTPFNELAGRGNPVGGPDVFESEADARERAEELGCGGMHEHQEFTRTLYMPCESHLEWQRATDRDVRENPCGCDRENPQPIQPTRHPRNQIIFAEATNTKTRRSFHGLIKERLVEKGVPASEIAIVNGTTITVRRNGETVEVQPSSDEKSELKQEAADLFNEGVFRVIIGNATISEGMNLDRHSVAVHHIDIPYRPSDIQQRNGRAVRQGNEWGEVDVNFYLMEGSFDGYRLQLVTNKAAWRDELLYGRDRTQDATDTSRSLSYEEMMAATAENPEVSTYFEAKNERNRLEKEIRSLETELKKTQRKLITAQDALDDTGSRLEDLIEAEKDVLATDLQWRGDTPQESAQKALGEEWPNEEQINIEAHDSNKYELTPPRLKSVKYPFEEWGKKFEVRTTITDEKRWAKRLVKTLLEVPSQNENARVRIDFNLPASQKRDWYYASSQADLVRRARTAADRLGYQALTGREALEFGSEAQLITEQTKAPSESDFGILEPAAENSNYEVLVDEEDFYRYYSIDPDQKREDETWKNFKRRIGMLGWQKWKALVRERLAQLVYALELQWYWSAEKRIERREKRLERLREDARRLPAEVEKLESRLETKTQSYEDAAATVEELRDEVNDLIEHEFQGRAPLYRELSAIAPCYGIEPPVGPHVVGDYDEYFAQGVGATDPDLPPTEQWVEAFDEEVCPPDAEDGALSPEVPLRTDRQGPEIRQVRFEPWDMDRFRETMQEKGHRQKARSFDYLLTKGSDDTVLAAMNALRKEFDDRHGVDPLFAEPEPWAFLPSEPQGADLRRGYAISDLRQPMQRIRGAMIRALDHRYWVHIGAKRAEWTEIHKYEAVVEEQIRRVEEITGEEIGVPDWRRAHLFLLEDGEPTKRQEMPDHAVAGQEKTHGPAGVPDVMRMPALRAIGLEEPSDVDLFGDDGYWIDLPAATLLLRPIEDAFPGGPARMHRAFSVEVDGDAAEAGAFIQKTFDQYRREGDRSSETGQAAAEPDPEPEAEPQAGASPTGSDTPGEAVEELTPRDVPLGLIDVDPDTFQPRGAGYNEQSAQRVAKNENPQLMDPVDIWPKALDARTEEEEGYWMLAGHSRLEGYKRRGEETIPAVTREFDSLQEAVDFAWEENSKGADLALEEKAKNLRRLRRRDELTMEAQREIAQERYARNANTVLALSYLNPNGRAVSTLRAFEGNSTGDRQRALKIAQWLGKVRMRYREDSGGPHLSDSHERELYRFLRENIAEQGRGFTAYRAFREFVDNALSRLDFDESEPLNLDRLAPRSKDEQVIDRRLEETRKELQEAKQARDRKREELMRRRVAGDEDISEEDIHRALRPFEKQVQAAQQELIKRRQRAPKARQEVKRSQQSIFDQMRENPITRWSKDDWVTLGKASMLVTTEDTISGDFHLFANAALNALILVPPKDVDPARDSASEEAEEAFEEWHHFDADKSESRDLKFRLDRQAPRESLGTASQIRYRSDKVMREGDRPGEMNRYYHYFDGSLHDVVRVGDAYVVGAELTDEGTLDLGDSTLKISGRGIEN